MKLVHTVASHISVQKKIDSMLVKLKDVSTRMNYNSVAFIMELQRETKNKGCSQFSKYRS